MNELRQAGRREVSNGSFVEEIRVQDDTDFAKVDEVDISSKETGIDTDNLLVLTTQVDESDGFEVRVICERSKSAATFVLRGSQLDRQIELVRSSGFGVFELTEVVSFLERMGNRFSALESSLHGLEG